MRRFIVTLEGKRYEVEVEEVGGEPIKAPDKAIPDNAKPAASASGDIPGSGFKVKAPLNGNILSVKVKEGDNVKKGDVLLTLEALKMENEIVAPSDGRVTGIHVTLGSNVETGDVLVTLE